MKAVIVLGVFGDAEHAAHLARTVDLAVYATRYPAQFYAPEPPAGCRSRVFRPMVPTGRGHQLWVYRGMSAALDEDAPDVVHVRTEPWGMLANQVVTWARRHPGTAVVVHAADRIWWHGSPPEILAKRWLARRVLRRIQGFAGQTAEVIDLAGPAGLPGGVPTAIVQQFSRDPALFRPPADPGERRDARERLGLPVDGVGIGFAGRFSAEKGPLEYLQAVRVASPGLKGAWAAMAGSGPLDGAVNAAASGLDVHMLGAVPFPDGVADFYRAVDVFVVPSVRTAESEDQSPRSAIEAMMSGCVVVGSDCGAIPLMLGETGIVTRQGDVDDLARGIIAGVARSADAELRPSARCRAVSLYSPETAARETIELWERALAWATGPDGRRSPSRPAVGP